MFGNGYLKFFLFKGIRINSVQLKLTNKTVDETNLKHIELYFEHEILRYIFLKDLISKSLADSKIHKLNRMILYGSVRGTAV